MRVNGVTVAGAACAAGRRKCNKNVVKLVNRTMRLNEKGVSTRSCQMGRKIPRITRLRVTDGTRICGMSKSYDVVFLKIFLNQ